MRPLLLLHPLGSSAAFWDPVAEAWPGPVVAVDLPGHGDAPLPVVDDGLAGCAAHVLAALDAHGAVGAHDRVDVAGVSLGGLVAQQLAATAPDRVGSLVLADTVVRYPEPMLATWAARAATARAEGMAALVEATLEVWFEPGFRDARPDVVEAVVATLLATDPEGYARTCEVLAGADTTPLLGRIVAPVLAVCGEADAPPFREAATTLLAPLGERPPYWLPGRHAAVLEHPALFVEALRSFLHASTATPDRTP